MDFTDDDVSDDVSWAVNKRAELESDESEDADDSSDVNTQTQV